MPLVGTAIQTKARSLYADLTKDTEDAPSFLASSGWFDRFKQHFRFHNTKLTGEAAAADHITAEEFSRTLFKKFITDGGYTPKQVFNLDETGLFWKRMPSRTFISIEEKTAPGFKAAKDRCTLLFGGNASGDCKLKPLMIYHSQNPRALKGCDKSRLPVHWKCNKKGWMTSAIFSDYFTRELNDELKAYCEKEHIPFKILILLDNVSSHPPFIAELSKNIQVVFLPPNTTSILQPMDQGVIATFKAYYLRRTFSKLIGQCDADDKLTIKAFWRQFNIHMAIGMIRDSWNEITPQCMNGVWKKLWPEAVEVVSEDGVGNDIGGATREIADMAQHIGFTDVDEENVREVLNSHVEDLTNEDLMIIEEERIVKEQEDEEIDEVQPEKKLTTKIMAQAFQMIDSAMSIFEEHDPDTMRSSQVKREVEHVMKCYKDLYSQKIKKRTQPSIKMFFTKHHGVSNDSPASSKNPTSATTVSPGNSTSSTLIAKGGRLTTTSTDSSDVDDPEDIM